MFDRKAYMLVWNKKNHQRKVEWMRKARAEGRFGYKPKPNLEVKSGNAKWKELLIEDRLWKLSKQ